MTISKKKIKNIRSEYFSQGINDKDLHKSPFDFFNIWLNESIEKKTNEPTTMHLSTVNADGKPSGRIVLLKEFSDAGFVFFTNYESRKASDLNSNNSASLTFFWPELYRQVRIEGTVEKVTPEDSDKYFQSRPRGSQIAALASQQSKILKSRIELDSIVEKLTLEYKNKPLIRPKSWGGYILRPNRIEFWQGRENRLHDRVCYILNNSHDWNIVRLFP